MCQVGGYSRTYCQVGPGGPAPGRGQGETRRAQKKGPAEAEPFRGARDQIAATCFAMADLRFAAWFLWMTPFEAALSSFLAAMRSEV